jgi:hypothetical protein
MDWVALGTPRLLHFLNRGAFVLGIGVMASAPPQKNWSSLMEKIPYGTAYSRESEMPRKKYTEGRITLVMKELENGVKVEDRCR